MRVIHELYILYVIYVLEYSVVYYMALYVGDVTSLLLEWIQYTIATIYLLMEVSFM
jgi:hypothetical protein